MEGEGGVGKGEQENTTNTQTKKMSWFCLMPAPCAPPVSLLAGQNKKIKSRWLCVSITL